MKTRIDFDSKTLQGALFDKLADGRWQINETTGKPQPRSKLNGKRVTGISPRNVRGLYVRFNSNTYNHALVVVRAKRKNRTTGELISNGEKRTLGTLADFYVGKTDGKKKYRLNDILTAVSDWYTNGIPETHKKQGDDVIVSVRSCLDEYLADRLAKLDADGAIVQLNDLPITKSIKTLQQVVANVNRYTSDWLDRCVTKIVAEEILDRAALIRDGKFLNGDGKRIGRYNTARSWLGSMSTIHKAATLRHSSTNLFEGTLKKYPVCSKPQRCFTPDEIAVFLNWKLDRTPSDAGLKPDSHKFVRMLSIKFQLLTGFRCEDVVSLERSNIEIHNGERYIKHWNTKGKRWHWIPVTDCIAKVIDDAITTADNHPSMSGSAFVFPSSTGSRYHSGTKAFQVARDMLVGLDKIKPEPVERVNNERPHKRLVVSHDCRRTLETYAEQAGIDEMTRRMMTDHKEGLITQTYNSKSEAQQIVRAESLRNRFSAYGDLLFDIAARHRTTENKT